MRDYREVNQSSQLSSEDMSVFLVMSSSADVSTLKRLRQAFCCGKYLVTKQGKEFVLE